MSKIHIDDFRKEIKVPDGEEYAMVVERRFVGLRQSEIIRGFALGKASRGLEANQYNVTTRAAAGHSHAYDAAMLSGRGALESLAMHSPWFSRRPSGSSPHRGRCSEGPDTTIYRIHAMILASSVVSDVG